MILHVSISGVARITQPMRPEAVRLNARDPSRNHSEKTTLRLVNSLPTGSMSIGVHRHRIEDGARVWGGAVLER